MGKTVEISVEEYKKLVQDSATLNVLKNYVVNSRYVCDAEIRGMFGIKAKEEAENIDYTDNADAGVVYSCDDEQKGIGE